MLKPNSQYSSSSLKEVLNMFRYADGISFNMWLSLSDWACDFAIGVWPTKACATVQARQFLSHNLQIITHQTETAWQLEEFVNFHTHICHNLKFIQDDLDFRWINDDVDRCRDYEVSRLCLTG